MTVNCPLTWMWTTAHLIHCQVDAGVGNDSQHVGDVALIKRTKSFSPKYLLSAVRDAGVLAGFSQGEASFKQLREDSEKKDV